MRIIWLILALFLNACGSTAQPVANISPHAGSVSAQMHCLSKGYERGGYDYDSCYRNRPEVQAYERSGRLSSLSIIQANRSPRTYRGRSYPVE